jgi:hypothetical protein
MIFCVVVILNISHCQINPNNFSSHHFDAFLHPATLSAEHYSELSIQGSMEWTSFDDAPDNFTILGRVIDDFNRRWAFGAGLNRSTFGSMQSLIISGTYSYNIVNKDINLSIGITPRLEQMSTIFIEGRNSELIEDINENQFGLRTGVFYKSLGIYDDIDSYYFIGLSIEYLQRNFYDNTMKPNWFTFSFIGGYNWQLSRKYNLKPRIIAEFLSESKKLVSINTSLNLERLHYSDQWGYYLNIGHLAFSSDANKPNIVSTSIINLGSGLAFMLQTETNSKKEYKMIRIGAFYQYGLSLLNTYSVNFYGLNFTIRFNESGI